VRYRRNHRHDRSYGKDPSLPGDRRNTRQTWSSTMTPSTSHLTKEELTDNPLGVSSLTVNAHLLGCPACADELERVKRTLAGFRDAAHGWSDHALESAENRASRARISGMRSRRTVWILAAAAAMILFIAGSVGYFARGPAVSPGDSAVVST